MRPLERYRVLNSGYVPINPLKPDVGESGTGKVSGVIHSEGGRAEWVLPAVPDAVRTARSRVRGTLGEWGLDSAGDTVALLVSELVTNALRHATGPIGVRLAHRPAGRAGVLLVEVSDPLPNPPRERVAHPEDEGGRGLRLVASSACRWGTRPGAVGKTVWFELAVPR